MTRGKSSRTHSAAGASAGSLPLFDQNSSIDLPAGGLNDDSMVRGVITASIKQSGQTREQIADRMSFLLNVQVTARMITSFTAGSKELHRWPGAWDRAFCAAVGDDTLLLCRVKAAGYVILKGTDVKLLELGREYLRQKRAAAKMESLESGLQGVEL